MKRTAFAVVLETALVAMAASAQSVVTSTLDDQQSVGLTVYTSGRGMVTDERRVELPAGRVELELRDVAESIIPETVGVEIDPAAEVLEQNYEYDLLSPQTLLNKYVGETVQMEVAWPTPEGGSEVRLVPATLLSVENGSVWRMEDGIVLNPPYRRLLFPSVPTNLRDRPTLVWLLDSARVAPRTVTATYLAQRMSWKADYVLTLAESGETGALAGWVTLDNQSGATYRDARLRLIAGDVHTVPTEAPAGRMYEARAMKTAEIAEEAFSEYHLYTVPRPVTAKQNQSKQISLLEAEPVTVERSYRVEMPSSFFASRRTARDTLPVAVELAFRNADQNSLGVPLPKGVVRVYRKHADGSALFVGEDRIEHTPKDETVELALGNAFDLVAEGRQTDFSSLAEDLKESAWEVVLRNHKDEAVTIGIEATLSGDWEIVDSSIPWTKVDFRTVRFQATVEPDGETTVTWRARTRW